MKIFSMREAEFHVDAVYYMKKFILMCAVCQYVLTLCTCASV